VAIDPSVNKPEYTLDAEVYTIGRSSGCHIVISDDHKLISRIHATIERTGQRYVLNDAGSANGTFINGRRIQGTHILAHDDKIALGSLQVLLRFVDPDPTTLGGGDLLYNPMRASFLIGGKSIDLTPSQHKLLLHLYQHAYSVCSKESCAEAIWGHDYNPGMDAGALDQTLMTLRRRLSDVKPDGQFIQTKRGIGYMLVPSGVVDESFHSGSTA
jgi:pSer/pThr/pTyr-binding forkhead associated (FHA) protein